MCEATNFVITSSKRQMSERRRALFRSVDGDMFYPPSVWPNDMRSAFWKKPIGDEETFKLVLFLMGNGCPPTMIKDWIVSSTFWDKNKTVKRWEQVNWIIANITKHERRWFYFDLHFKKFLYMDRSERVKGSSSN
ncbi:Hypothetical predicted protein [Paramuricea clavata]|uniref:Uncharacterized protein n=1 Tax=Paramuricea clavata TaxID=317549 RepID=A0A7D9LW18_PARCT|nr:Hypothetical predicted protein [Paramuricea clavata]